MAGGRTASAVLAAALSCASLGLAAVAAPAPVQLRTLRDGVFTEEQAERGGKLFVSACAECHQTVDFEGYLNGWIGLPVGYLYESIRAQMPEDNPGGLSRDEYADVMAYLFQINGLPPGDEEMGSDEPALNAIVIAVVAPGPSSPSRERAAPR